MINNSIEYSVKGKYALFTDPITKMGGEKCSYHIPTYEAIKGLTKNIYWKPTFIWIIDKIRIMNQIRTQTKGIKTKNYVDNKNDLSIYSYLYDVEYQVKAHFEWNLFQKELEVDRNFKKHLEIAQRRILKGSTFPTFLGTSECSADIMPCTFGDGNGYYDDYDELTYGIMFHSFSYPNESGKSELLSYWNKTIMKKGIIEFIRPEQCQAKKIYNKTPKFYTLGVNCESVEDTHEFI